MPVEFQCGACGRMLRTPDGSQGKQGRCPHCQQVMTIPQRASSETPAHHESATGSQNPAPVKSPVQPGPGLAPGKPANPFADPADGPAPTVHRKPSTPYQGFQNAPLYGGSYDPAIRPHRAGMILGFGITSISGGVIALIGVISAVLPLPCCCLISPVMGLVGIGFGIPSWLMGSTDLQLMQRGAMDRLGLQNTKTGRILGIAGFSLAIAALILSAVVFSILLLVAGQQR